MFPFENFRATEVIKMVRKETIEFFEKYRDLIRLVEQHGSPEIRKIAAAIRLAVEDAKRRGVFK